MEIKQGKLIWITGLPATGKTTIAKRLFEEVKKKHSNVVHLDGDNMRSAWGIWAEKSTEGRRKMSMSYAKMCEILTKQGIHVIMSTVALFNDVHKYNRDNTKELYEVVVETSDDILDVRHGEDTSHMPEKSRWKDPNHEFPPTPELVVQNDTQEHIEDNVKKILKLTKLN